ncbi:LysE family translocator [uncultured Maritimibacter sp.]|jgi:threonine/homoserine/homoserine lactone efflux protein|uniref:LysE family translocator n=1 Tax=uncultured Maritimibacter sp. TaxID=991866 RepID=UPI000A83922A|nr:LysE family translocator [uncultured Maritimibacter sp.]
MIFGLDAATLAAFLGAGIVLNLTPGADVMFATASGASGGPKAGVAAALGVALGALLHTLLATFGLSALLEAEPRLFAAITYLGAAYLIYLAWKTWVAPAPEPGRGAASARRAIARGFVTNALNPKVALFILAFLPQFTRPEAGNVTLQMLTLGALFTVTGFAITSGYGVLAGVAGARIARGRLMNRVSAVVFAVLALRLVAGDLPAKS